MKRIWKYTFDSHDVQSSWYIPKDAMVLHIREQHGHLCIWMLVETENDNELRTFKMTGTGTHIDFDTNKAVYLGTGFMDNGNFVFHIFEVTSCAE